MARAVRCLLEVRRAPGTPAVTRSDNRRVAYSRGEHRSMSLRPCLIRRCALLAAAATATCALAPSARATGGGSGLAPPSRAPSGGAPIGGLAPTRKRPSKVPPPPSTHDHGKWLTGVEITEYWPAPERWFVGRLVSAPSLAGKHRIDWLYSAMGVSMEGDGLGLDGRTYHIDALGSGGWVTASGAGTSPSNGWAGGAPYWRAGGYWRNRSGGVTFPLQRGGWSAGTGHAYVPLRGVTFANGASLPLRFYQSIAVDPGVIPLGSRVYIPAYRRDGYGGWFVARDTGGAIGGRHVDVYRSPPAQSSDTGQYLVGQRVYVIKPRR
jgi:3D (Asp-Asp-Asp) domain-containing protein